VDSAKHAEHSSSELTEGHEGIRERRGFRVKNGFAEPLVDYVSVVEHALKQRPQRLQIQQSFRDVEDQHARRPIEPLSPDKARVEEGADRHAPDPCKEGTAADWVQITHATSPFESVI
jgi:hypothetical protein